MTSDYIERIRAIKAEISTVHGPDNIREIIADDYGQGDELDILLREIISVAFDAGVHSSSKWFTKAGVNKRNHLANQQAEELAPIIKDIIRCGKNLNPDIADELNWRGIKTRNGHEWRTNTVRLLRERIRTITNDLNSPSKE